jgi:hypothetical protein
MAAIRRNERIGPGMDASSTECEGLAVDFCAASAGTAAKEEANNPESKHKDMQRKKWEKAR